MARLTSVQYAVLAAALITSGTLWYLFERRPGSDAPAIMERTEETYSQLEVIRHTVREQMAREAGQAAPGEDERERIRARTRALMEERLTEADIPNQLHPLMQDAVERDVMNRLEQRSDTARPGSDTELRLYRRAPGPGPVEYY